MRTASSSLPWQRDAIILFIAITAFFLIGLGYRPYLIPSEARYIEIPRQILATGDWLTPYINGVPYFEKPPLFYWLQAIVMGMLGLGESAGRLVTLLFDTGTCLLAYALGRMLYGRMTGLLSAGALATSVMGYGLSRIATLDVNVSFFLTACLTCFLAAQLTPDAAWRQRCYLMMYVAASLALMSKGLIGIVLPGLIIGVWIALTGRWCIITEAKPHIGIVILLVIAAPWHVLMARQHPDFLQYYFIHEHFTRYLTDEHRRIAPWWFFIAVTLAGWVPWTGLLPSAIKDIKGNNWTQHLRQDPHLLFLVLWVIVPLVFFSTSQSKLVAYIFPIFPPIAVLIGDRLAKLWEGKIPARPLRNSALFVLVFFSIAAAFPHFISFFPEKLAHKMGAFADIPSLMLLPLACSLIVLMMAVFRKPAPSTLICCLALTSITFGISANYIVGMQDQLTTKPLVESIRKELTDNDLVMTYQSYWQDLPVYLNRNIIVAGWTGELSFTVEHYPQTHQWMISTEEFWQRCITAPRNVYVFIREADTHDLHMKTGCQLQKIGQYGDTVLLKRTIE